MIEYRIVVENRKNEAVKVQLQESTPVAATDRIQIKGLALKPEPTARDWQSRAGVMMWELALAPEETQEIHSHFFVKHPKEWPPDGL